MKRIVLIFTSLALLLSLFGCAPNSAATPAANPTAADVVTETQAPEAKPSGKVVILSRDTALEGYDEYIAKAEAATGLDIEYIATPTNPDDRQAKFTTVLSSGDNTIDVVDINDDMISAFKRTGWLEPLDDVMTSDVAARFPKAYIDEMLMYDGHYYSMPLFLSVLVMWINQEILDKTGLETPTDKASFDAFLAAASDPTSGVYGYGDAWDKSYAYISLGVFVNQFGGDVTDWQNPNSRAAVEFMHDMVKNSYTPLDQMADIYESMHQKFFDGKYGIVLAFTGGIKQFINSGKYGPDGLHIIPMPRFENSTSYFSTWQYAINAASENKEGAKELLRWAASKEGQLAYHELTDRIPASAELRDDPDFKAEGLEEIRAYFANSDMRARTLAPQSIEYITAIGSLFQQYMADEITLDDFCKGAQEAVDTYVLGS
jgi:multiple sugar transport system substrate-binding protein